MIGTDTVVVVVALVVATAAWSFMFVPSRQGIWPRTWVAAGALSATSLACLAAVGRVGEILGPVNVTELAIGFGVGAAWLVATQLGYRVLVWLVPSFGAQVRDLYRLRDGHASPSQMVGPIIAMGFAEELLFRGVLQGVGGFAVGLAAYTAVQAFERKWALALAALLGGAVWGALFAWRLGLVAPIAAHVLWTGVLTFLWPLGDEEPVTSTRADSYASG